jgi:hypothetical protein
MLDIICVIMIYSYGPNGIERESKQVEGKFIKQSMGSEVYTVNFLQGLGQYHANFELNNHIQQVHHNACLFMKKERL